MEYLPQVDSIRSNGVVDTLRLRLAAGQTPQDLHDAAEGLRHLYGALRCSIRDDGPGLGAGPLLRPRPPHRRRHPATPADPARPAEQPGARGIPRDDEPAASRCRR